MNCKPGDLAVVVRDKDFPQNNGIFVTVLGLPRQENYEHQIELDDWEVQPSAPVWGWDNVEKTQASIGDDPLVFKDCELQPVRGIPVGEQAYKAAPIEHTTPKKVAA